MKHLNTYKLFESSNDNNEKYYTLLDVIQDVLDNEGITGIPDVEDPENYLGEPYETTDTKTHWGYHANQRIDNRNKFFATSDKADFEIKYIGIWNLSPDRFERLEAGIENEMERIIDAVGYIKITKQEITDSMWDMYISYTSEREFKRLRRNEKIKWAKDILKKYDVGALSNNKQDEAFELIDKLNKLRLR